MQQLNFVWKENKAQYQTGETLYLGTIPIASYAWNSSKSKDDKTPNTNYIGSVDLPRLQGYRVTEGTTDSIKRRLEKLVLKWFAEVLK